MWKKRGDTPQSATYFSLVPEQKTALKRNMCASQLPLSLPIDGRGAVWSLNNKAVLVRQHGERRSTLQAAGLLGCVKGTVDKSRVTI
jgi:hypothetical protein